jgi:tRNA G46 methylase TrmB
MTDALPWLFRLAFSRQAFARDTPRGAIVVDIGIGAGSPLCNAAVRAAIAERELTWIGIDIDAPGIALAASDTRVLF